ncbi:hypothetical protein CCACVL1_18471 [Corchorus capsularis]|uniref:Uncharacterized protein n=1 Tax=Corchorus capsularis TaxID=210143 RepID=A0A1R3HL45_COCAP|nr:hypothetical protein CCACVL1_18471 [Corchorus capsularis]
MGAVGVHQNRKQVPCYFGVQLQTPVWRMAMKSIVRDLKIL